MELVASMLSKPSNSNNSNSNKWCNSSRRLSLVHRTLELLEMSQTATSISLLATTPCQGKILLHHLRLYTSNSSIIWTVGLHNFPMRTLKHRFRNNSSHRWLLIKWAGNNNNSSNSSSINNLLLSEATLLLPLVAILKVMRPHKTLLKLLHPAHLTLAWWMMRLLELLKSRTDCSFAMSLALR